MEPNTVYTVLMIAGLLAGGGVVWGVTKNSITVIQSSLKEQHTQLESGLKDQREKIESGLKDQKEKLDIINDKLNVHTGQIAVIINRLDTIEQNVRDINTLFLAQNRIKP